MNGVASVGCAGSIPPAASAIIVCKANVCRSPTVAFFAGRSRALVTTSAGMRTQPGSAMCPIAATRISSYDGGPSYGEVFRSSSVESLDLDRFDLILAATRTIRGDLVKHHPWLRGRAFTVREAVALANRPLSTTEAATLLAAGPAPVMAARRGTVARSPASDTRRWGRTPDAFDLPDAHNDRRSRRHAATVDLAVTTGNALGTALQSWRTAAPGLAQSDT